MKNISYGRQDIHDDDLKAVLESLKSDYLTQGPRVSEFEKYFSEFVGAEQAVAVCNATAALHISAMALGVKPGTRVLTTPNTFVASANCVRYCGGEIEFVDIDSETFCIDPEKLEEKLSNAPKGTYSGIIPVSFAGYPVDGARLRQIADRHGLWIIEDACHAPGAEFQVADGTWKRTGSGEYADLSVFSFHPVKHIATGEGGMITTQNAELAERLRLLRSHGINRDPKSFTRNDGPWYYEMQSLGFNYRISDINCALGLSQLKRMEQNLARRREIAATYSRELQGLDLQTPSVAENVKHAYHLYVIQVPRRLELYNFLKSQGIYCQVHYIPVHRQPYYENTYGKQSFPVAEHYYERCLSLPMFHALTDEDLHYVISQVRSFYGK